MVTFRDHDLRIDKKCDRYVEQEIVVVETALETLQSCHVDLGSWCSFLASIVECALYA